MPNITGPAFTFPSRSFPQQQAGVPAASQGEFSLSELVGKYSTLVKAQKVFYVSAQITAPVIFSTAGQLGPMLWNKPGSGLDAHLLAIAVSYPSTAATVAGSIGWASNVQPTAPTSPTAITPINAYAGGGPSAMAAVNSGGTVIVLPAPIFLPIVAVNTGAVSTPGISQIWTDVGGGVIVGPSNVGYVCGSATLSTMVTFIGILWAELPV